MESLRIVEISTLESSHMKTVFHVTEEVRFQGAIQGAFNLLADDSVSMDEVVILANGSAVKGSLKAGITEELATEAIIKGLKLKVCNNSLLGLRIDRSSLVDGVEVVPSGVGELTRPQSEGFVYIRV